MAVGLIVSLSLSLSLPVSPGKDSKTEGVPPSLVSLVPEEKVSFSLYAVSVSSLTVAKIRKVYNKQDSKAIAKQVSSEHTPTHPLDGSPSYTGDLRMLLLGRKDTVPLACAH